MNNIKLWAYDTDSPKTQLTKKGALSLTLTCNSFKCQLMSLVK